MARAALAASNTTATGARCATCPNVRRVARRCRSSRLEEGVFTGDRKRSSLRVSAPDGGDETPESFDKRRLARLQQQLGSRIARRSWYKICRNASCIFWETEHERNAGDYEQTKSQRVFARSGTRGGGNWRKQSARSKPLRRRTVGRVRRGKTKRYTSLRS